MQYDEIIELSQQKSSNTMFNEQIKHKSVLSFHKRDCNQGDVSTPYVNSKEKVGDMFTKVLPKNLFVFFCYKLGMTNIQTPA